MVGFTMGVARLSKNWLIARLATVYVELVRNVPLLLQLFVWYFMLLQPDAANTSELGAFGRRLSQSARAVSPRPHTFEGFRIRIAGTG